MIAWQDRWLDGWRGVVKTWFKGLLIAVLNRNSFLLSVTWMSFNCPLEAWLFKTWKVACHLAWNSHWITKCFTTLWWSGSTLPTNNVYVRFTEEQPDERPPQNKLSPLLGSYISFPYTNECQSAHEVYKGIKAQCSINELPLNAS